LERTGDCIHAWVHAAPTDGAANEALIRMLAEALDVPRSRLTIMRGHASRNKAVRIAGMVAADALARIPEGTSR